jgi:hypothetical protein
MYEQRTATFEAVGTDGFAHTIEQQTHVFPHRDDDGLGLSMQREWFADGKRVELNDEHRGEYRIPATGARLRRLPITD